jgi:phosphate starvation-inducible membrane PsiE
MKVGELMKSKCIKNRIDLIANYTEIFLSLLLIIGILLLSIGIFKDIFKIILSINEPKISIDINEFLEHVIALIIGVEFVKMLTKHNFNSVIDVLVFAIARQSIINHNMIDILIGVLSMGILFIIKIFLYRSNQDNKKEYKFF